MKAMDSANVLNKVRKFQEKLTKASASRELIALAEGIIRELGDKDWAKKIYKKIEAKAKTFENFQWLAFYVSSFDEDCSDRLFEKAESIRIIEN